MKNKYRKIEVDGILYHWRIESPYDYDMDLVLKINKDKKEFKKIPLTYNNSFYDSEFVITPYIVRQCIKKDIIEIDFDTLDYMHKNNIRRKKINSLKEDL
jgi:hypothetical protein